MREAGVEQGDLSTPQCLLGLSLLVAVHACPGACRCPAAKQGCASCSMAGCSPACLLTRLPPVPCLLLACSKDMTLKEAEVLALSTLKQVMEEKVGGWVGG